MKKAWSFFWLVIASCVAVTIMFSMIEPYLGWIALIILVIVVGYIASRVRRYLRGGRRHF